MFLKNASRRKGNGRGQKSTITITHSTIEQISFKFAIKWGIRQIICLFIFLAILLIQKIFTSTYRPICPLPEQLTLQKWQQQLRKEQKSTCTCRKIETKIIKKISHGGRKVLEPLWLEQMRTMYFKKDILKDNLLNQRGRPDGPKWEVSLEEDVIARRDHRSIPFVRPPFTF